VCLILVAWDAHPDYPLVVAANRDEFFDRASAPMHWWEDLPILGGRDLTAGGGWLTLSASGRFAAVTNVRDFTRSQAAPRSRGEIPVGFSSGDTSPKEYLVGLPTDEFNGYNAVVSDLDSMWWGNNPPQAGGAPRAGTVAPVEPGIHGISNAALDTPWPKVVDGKRRFADAVESGVDVEDLFTVLADRTIAPDELLPDTGAGLEIERLASPAFITSPEYGTHASTVVRMRRDGSFDAEERRFLRGEETGRVVFKRGW
jgi:uncharacterized protein with NRDE domain